MKNKSVYKTILILCAVVNSSSALAADTLDMAACQLVKETLQEDFRRASIPSPEQVPLALTAGQKLRQKAILDVTQNMADSLNAAWSKAKVSKLDQLYKLVRDKKMNEDVFRRQFLAKLKDVQQESNSFKEEVGHDLFVKGEKVVSLKVDDRSFLQSGKYNYIVEACTRFSLVGIGKMVSERGSYPSHCESFSIDDAVKNPESASFSAEKVWTNWEELPQHLKPSAEIAVASAKTFEDFLKENKYPPECISLEKLAARNGEASNVPKSSLSGRSDSRKYSPSAASEFQSGKSESSKRSPGSRSASGE